METTTILPLARFRAAFSRDALGLRRDTLFDLLGAVSTDPWPTTFVRRSLIPGFARGWAGTCDALSRRSLDCSTARRLVVASLPGPVERELWALDGTTWPCRQNQSRSDLVSLRDPGPDSGRGGLRLKSDVLSVIEDIAIVGNPVLQHTASLCPSLLPRSFVIATM